jgi:hypothetical protein
MTHAELVEKINVVLKAQKAVQEDTLKFFPIGSNVIHPRCTDSKGVPYTAFVRDLGNNLDELLIFFPEAEVIVNCAIKELQKVCLPNKNSNLESPNLAVK